MKFFFFFQAEDGIRDYKVTGVQTCALPISIGHDTDGKPVYLRDLWPADAEITSVVDTVVDRSFFVERYGSIFEGDERWQSLPAPTGERYEWDPESTYIRRPPFLDQLTTEDTVFT